jgi:hypothetical protein
MSSKKVDRAIHGPGWGEVILGAILSLILGVIVGVVLLVIKPVVVAKELPKDPAPGTLYYVEGLHGDAGKARQALAKRKAFVEGQSIKVTEDEINALTASAVPAAPAPKPGQKAAAQPEPVKSGETVSTGVPNVRIRKGEMQVGVPITLSVFGFEQRIIAQARGGFEKQGDVFAYDPSEIYFGSCPVQKLPFVAGYIRQKLTSSQKIPDDIAAAWAKLANVSIEGNTLNLAMQ